MANQTPLKKYHQQAGAQLVDFAGWDMPLHYGSQIQEHNNVRQHAGMFDVSHMGVLDVTGAEAKSFLRKVLANDVEKLKTNGQALYTCMLNPQGGVIDDLIVYRLDDQHYRIVLNASRRQVDLDWLQQQSTAFEVKLALRPELCIIAVQGPEAISKVIAVLGTSAKDVADLKSFHCKLIDQCQIARTGYTGEDGVEIILPEEQAVQLWQQLAAVEVKPCGLGARDTLRLEAGLNLYGADMTEQTSPLESNLAWTVALADNDRDFIGRSALQKPKQKLVGLVMHEKGVLRNHQVVYCAGQQVGEITSGSFSPTLGHAIALARINGDISKDCYIDRRGKQIAVKIVKPPFVRHGKKVFSEE